jgi:hypothetical protein
LQQRDQVQNLKGLLGQRRRGEEQRKTRRNAWSALQNWKRMDGYIYERKGKETGEKQNAGKEICEIEAIVPHTPRHSSSQSGHDHILSPLVPSCPSSSSLVWMLLLCESFSGFWDFVQHISYAMIDVY